MVMEKKRQADIDPERAQSMARYWWLNIVRGGAAFFMAFGLILGFELVLDKHRLQEMLGQFLGLYLMASGLMSLIFGYTTHRRRGMWFTGGVIGVFGGVLFFFRPFYDGELSQYFSTAILGLIMLLTGLVHILGGYRIGRAYGRRWTLGHAFLGIVEIVIAIMLFLLPILETEIIFTALSIWGIIAGIGLISDGLRMRRSVRRKASGHT